MSRSRSRPLGATFHEIKTTLDSSSWGYSLINTLKLKKLSVLLKNELPPFSEAPRAPALDPGEGLSTPAAGPDTYIGLTSSMRSVTTLSEHVGLQADQEQVLYRELVCVYDEPQLCCEHAASAVTVHPRVKTLLLTRPSALLQAGTTS